MSALRIRASILIAVAILFRPAFAADVVIDWNQKANAAVLEAKVYPFAGTRVMAIVHTAMFDAINSIEGQYTPYKFKVSAPAGSSPEAAGNAAAHATLVALFPEQKAALDRAYQDSLAQIPDGAGKTAGIAVGEGGRSVTADAVSDAELTPESSSRRQQVLVAAADETLDPRAVRLDDWVQVE